MNDAATGHDMIRPFLRQLRLLTCLACLSSGAFPVVAQIGAPAPLSPEAQAAVDKGITAAKAQSYLLAVRYFQDARKIAPQAPEIFYNLGLAESKISGRELRAIAWFGAYLATVPGAPNAATLRGEIDRLEVISQINISRVMKSAQDAAARLKSNEVPGGRFSVAQVGQLSVEVQSRALQEVAALWAQAGDIQAALQTCNSIEDGLDKDFNRNAALGDVATYQAQAGDFAGALKTVARVTSWYTAVKVLTDIANIQSGVGDGAGAQKTLAIALKEAVAAKGDPANIDIAFDKIGRAQAKAGDPAGARATAGRLASYYYEAGIQLAIADFQIQAGNISEAKETLAAAQKTIDLIPTPENKSYTQQEAAKVRAKLDAAGVAGSAQQSITRVSQRAILPSDWIGKLDSDCAACNGLNIDLFLDLPGYLKSVRPGDNTEYYFRKLLYIASQLVSAQNTIEGWLKRQAGN